MNDLVIWFYGIILMMIKQPEAKRLLNWQLRFFERLVNSIDPTNEVYPYAMKMQEELTFCKRRRRSRRRLYNISNMDEVYGQYYIHPSQVTLDRAWNMFLSGAYRLEGYFDYA